MSLPIRDGRRLISYKFFHDEDGKEKVQGMDKSMSVFLQAMIRKYALPSRVKKPRNLHTLQTLKYLKVFILIM